MSYNEKVKHYLAAILALMLFGVPAVATHFGGQVDAFARLFSRGVDQLAAAVVSHDPKTVQEIKSRYLSPVVSIAPINSLVSQPKVRILIVPGHEPAYGGAEYRDLKERDMAEKLAQNLDSLLANDPHYQVFLTRDADGWTDLFKDYFKNDWDDIIAWQKASAKDMAHRVATGSSTKPVRLVYHNKVPNGVAYRLYGINKWSNENDIDITIHIHFNDDPERRGDRPGSHTGFAIYIPEHQYANSTTSRSVAESLFDRLKEYNKVSDLNGESQGIVEEPDLIAVGAHDTANAATLLIEYGYIYEPQFSTLNGREKALRDLAYQTYFGLEDFFNSR